MLYIIITSILYTIISCGFGSVMDSNFNKNQLYSIRLINGLLLIGIIALVIAIVVPLNIYFESTITLIGIFLFIANKCWRWPIKIQPKFLLFALLIGVVGSVNSFLYDTFSYYLPTIKWLDEFGLVKGIANYDFNLGQHSLWHIIQASFNDSFDFYYKLNSFLLLIFLVYIIEIRKTILLLFLPLFFLFAATPSPDLAVFILSIIMLSQWILYHRNSLSVNLIYSALLILIKPIAFVLPLYFFFESTKNWRNFKKTYVIVGILALLFFIKNLILTANFIFPLKGGNITSLIHSIPNEIYDISKIDGRLVTLKHVENINLAEFKLLTLFEYYQFLLNNLHYTILFFCGFAFICFVFFIYQIIQNKSWKVLSVLIIVKVIVFGLISVQYRFLLDLILMIALILIWKYHISWKLLLGGSIFATLLIICYPHFIKDKINSTRLAQPYTLNHLLVPQKNKVEVEEVKLFGQAVLVITNYDFSLDVKPFNLNKKLIDRYVYQNYHAELIDSSNVKCGFKAVKNSEEDVKELTKIFRMINQRRVNK